MMMVIQHVTYLADELERGLNKLFDNIKEKIKQGQNNGGGNEKNKRRNNKDGVFGYKENRGLEKIRGNR